MGLKKLKDLFIKSSKPSRKPLKIAASTSKDSKVEPNRDNHSSTKKPNLSKEEAIRQKAEVEQLQRAISSKLKDPAMAKKAAQIIEELLKGKLP